MTPRRLARLGLAAAAMAIATPSSWALYKIVGPDGSVTYTDRPPAATAGRVTPIGRDAREEPASASPLPTELRQVAAKYPVTLYTSSECPPCDSGRRLLAQRGIPVTEKIIASNEDGDALQRLTGGRTVPALTIGGQALRGYLESEWHDYLDAAGYPRESRLPRDYKPLPPTPLVGRVAEPAPAEPAPPRTPPRDDAVPAPPSAPPGSIRF